MRPLSPIAIALTVSFAAHAYERVPYAKSGIADCATPGTNIEFALNGSGGATVASVKSNYAPFLKAARSVHVWRADTVEADNKQLLVLDNGQNTRIMINLADGKGIAVSGANGASDILCQVLVKP